MRTAARASSASATTRWPYRGEPSTARATSVRGDQAERPLREGAGRARADPHPQHAGPVHRDVVGQRLDRRFALLLRLDDHPVAVAVPGERDRADAEVFGERQVERAVVAQRRRSALRDVGRLGAAQYLVEQFVDPFGEQAHLELLKY